MPFFRSCLRAVLWLPLALLLLFEEWGWEPLARAMAMLARLPVWCRLEKAVRVLPPWGALAVLAVPVLLLLPVKLLALYWFGIGHKTWGIAVLLLAKVVGTSIVARLFQLTESTLMQLAWLAHWYPRWKHWKDQLTDRIRSSPVWRTGWQLKARMRAWIDTLRAD